MEGTCREVTCLWFPPWAFYLDVHQPGLIPGCFQMIPRGRAGSRGVQGSAASCSSSHVSPFPWPRFLELASSRFWAYSDTSSRADPLLASRTAQHRPRVISRQRSAPSPMALPAAWRHWQPGPVLSLGQPPSPLLAGGSCHRALCPVGCCVCFSNHFLVWTDRLETVTYFQV